MGIGLEITDPILKAGYPFYRLVSEKIVTLKDLDTITYDEVLRLNALLDIKDYTQTAQDGYQCIEMDKQRLAMGNKR